MTMRQAANKLIRYEQSKYLTDELACIKSKSPRTITIVGLTVAGLGGIYLACRFTRNKTERKNLKGNENKSDPKDIAIENRQKGNELFKEEKYEEAVEIYKEATEILENVEDSKKLRAILHQNIAACFEHLSNAEQVIEQCNLAIQLDVTYAKAYRRKSKALANQHKDTEALFNITVTAILEKFLLAETLVETDKYLKVVVVSKLKSVTESQNYPLVARGLVHQYFSSFYRDIFCYLQFVIPIIEGTQREVESRGNSKMFFQNIFDPKIYSIRDTYFSGAFLNADDIANVINNLKLFIQQQENVSDQLLDVVRNLGAAFGFLGSIYFIHGHFDDAGDCLKRGLLILKSYPNDEVVKLLKVSILLKYSTLLLQLENLDECLRRIDEAEITDNQNIDIYYHRLQLQLPMNNLEEASKTNRKAMTLINIETFPNDINLIGVLEAQQSIIELRKDYCELSISKTEMEMMRIIEEYPSNYDILHLIAQFYRLQGKIDEMQKYIDRMKHKCKNFVNLYEIQLMMHQISGGNSQIKDIQSEVQSMLLREKNSDSLHQLNAQLFMQIDDLSGVLMSFEKMVPLTKHPKDLLYIMHAITAIDVHLSVLDYLEERNINKTIDLEELRRATSIQLKRSLNSF
ncbi:hypothetical protein SNEBB_001523 [Seison nebaliae]|nr:hypothetical protein SNEBB_001523 [Seison nebaliae]